MKLVQNIPDYFLVEADSMLDRLYQMKPFSMTMTMVKSAAVSDEAFNSVNSHLLEKRRELESSVKEFRHHVAKANQQVSPEQMQQKFASLRIRFKSILDQIDIYADVLSQRSEQETGTWLRGLDLLATDGLKPGKNHFKIPPLMVYLERGHGAAIRRARTRLPGGDINPVAVIQIPRERMVGSGIASSLIHETGHQGAELLGFTNELKKAIREIGSSRGKNSRAWIYFERWASEIVADFWAISQLGITATLGLMGVVTLPSYFQFRLDMLDPHPAPFIRVMLSCRTGKYLFPDKQWDKTEALWKAFYPFSSLPAAKKSDLEMLLAELDPFVRLLAQLQLPSLDNNQVASIFPISERQPAMLREQFSAIESNPDYSGQLSPTLLFAVTGQAKADKRIESHSESRLLRQQLTRWAVSNYQ